jgi:hypothetical protein
MMLRAGLSALMVAGVAACTAAAPPTTPPAYTEAAPVPSEEGHVSYVATRTLAVPAATAKAWIDEGRMFDALTSTDKVSKPAKSEILSGIWPQTGAVRRVTQADGHFIAERVIENTESGFSYQIYGLTSAAGNSIAYGLGEFRVTPVDASSCTLTWIYQLKPKNPVAGFFVNRFVKNDFAPFMEGGMEGLTRLAEAEAAE